MPNRSASRRLRAAHVIGIGTALLLAAGCGSAGPTIVATAMPAPASPSTAIPYTAASSPVPIATTLEVDASPSAGAPGVIGDSCLVGTWVADRVEEPATFTVGGTTVPIAGGGGLLFSFAPDGSEVNDYTNSEPLVGLYKGTALFVTVRGSASSQVVTDGSKGVETGAPVTLHGSVAVGGIVIATPDITFAPTTFTYICSDTSLQTHDLTGTNILFHRR
jgi:hypothetical protein